MAQAQAQPPTAILEGDEITTIQPIAAHIATAEEQLAALEKEEGPRLEKKANEVVQYLAGMTLLMLALSVAFVYLTETSQSAGRLWVMLACVCVGTLGSSLSAMVSAMDRIAAGWEFSNGWKWPPDPKASSPKDDTRAMFGERLRRGFLARPILGAATGFLAYLGLSSGGLQSKGAAGNDSRSLFLIFVAFLGGLAAKSFLEKLRSIFSAMFH